MNKLTMDKLKEIIDKGNKLYCMKCKNNEIRRDIELYKGSLHYKEEQQYTIDRLWDDIKATKGGWICTDCEMQHMDYEYVVNKINEIMGGE
jgi:hypothetical protein